MSSTLDAVVEVDETKEAEDSFHERRSNLDDDRADEDQDAGSVLQYDGDVCNPSLEMIVVGPGDQEHVEASEDDHQDGDDDDDRNEEATVDALTAQALAKLIRVVAHASIGTEDCAGVWGEAVAGALRLEAELADSRREHAARWEHQAVAYEVDGRDGVATAGDAVPWWGVGIVRSARGCLEATAVGGARPEIITPSRA